jgi:hypothetical protein
MTLPFTRRTRIRIAVWLTVPGLGVILGCGAGNRLFYWPNNLVYNQPGKFGVKIEEVTFTSEDGTRLSGWFIPAQAAAGKLIPARGTVIYFHGNAENLTAHYDFVAWLPAEGYNLFLFDYRGFGRSEGTCTREGTFLDSVAALKYVRSRADVDPKTLVAFGQSLGGACALSALGETDPQQVRGLAVESTFYSYQGLGQDKLAANPVGWLVSWPLSRWLVTDEHSPSHSLARISPLPLLVIHGDADQIVPYSQGQALFEHAGEPKQFIHVPGGQHVEAIGGYRFGDKYRTMLLKFFDDCIR